MGLAPWVVVREVRIESRLGRETVVRYHGASRPLGARRVLHRVRMSYAKRQARHEERGRYGRKMHGVDIGRPPISRLV